MSIILAPSTIGRKYGFKRPPYGNVRLRSVLRADSAIVFPEKFDLLKWLTDVKDQE